QVHRTVERWRVLLPFETEPALDPGGCVEDSAFEFEQRSLERGNQVRNHLGGHPGWRSSILSCARSGAVPGPGCKRDEERGWTGKRKGAADGRPRYGSGIRCRPRSALVGGYDTSRDVAALALLVFRHAQHDHQVGDLVGDEGNHAAPDTRHQHAESLDPVLAADREIGRPGATERR